MKKIISVFLAVLMLMSLAACGGGEGNRTADIIAEAESYGNMAGQGSYTTSMHVEDIVVIVALEEGGFVSALESAVGSLEYYNNPAYVSDMGGIVIEKDTEGSKGYMAYYDVISEEGAEEEEDSSVPEEEAEETESEGDAEVAAKPRGELQVKEASLLKGATAMVAPGSMDVESIEYKGEEYNFSGEDFTGAEGQEHRVNITGAKWLLAQQSVAFDNWKAQRAEKMGQDVFDKMVTAGDEIKTAAGENWKFNSDYINYCKDNVDYAKYEEYKDFIAYIESIIAAMEAVVEDAASDPMAYNNAYEKLLEEHEYEQSLISVYTTIAEAEKALPALQTAAEDDFLALNTEIEEIKKVGEDYKDDDRYVRIKVEHPDIGKYEDQLASIELLKESIATLEQMYQESDYKIIEYISEYATADQECYVNYYQARFAYLNAIVNKEKYEAANAEDIAAMNSAIDAVKEKYTGDDYKNDVEYMKLQIKYGKLISDLALYDNDIAEKKAAVEAAVAEREEVTAEFEKDVFERRAEISRDNDINKISEYLNGLYEEINAVLESEPGEKSKIILEKDGFAVVRMSASIVDSVDSSRDVIVPNSGGGGSSGGKLCASPGCTNKAVTSGDSIYCSTHSNRCLECGCYIDGDAMYCMDCLFSALS